MKKLLSSILVFVLILVFALPTKTDAVQVFSDVPTSHPNYNDITYLLDAGVINKSDKYGVKDIVTREDVAVMVAKAVGLNGKQRTTKFKDVPQSNVNSGYIQSATEVGIINGYDDGSFKPNAQVTRGHMAAFIARAFELPMGSKTFKDVPVGHTAYEAVKQLAAANITTGYDDGTFKPQNSLTRAHISAFLARAMRFAEGGITVSDNTVTADKIIQQFKNDSLEIGQVSDLANKEFGNVRKEGKRILIPSLGDDAGGRLFIFNKVEDLEKAKAYYDGLSNSGPLFYSHTHQNELVLLQMNGDMEDAEFKKYAISLDTALSGKEITTPVVKPEPVKESYKNCTELRKVYPDGVDSSHPAYEMQHDGDKDGWACEPVDEVVIPIPEPEIVQEPTPAPVEYFKNCTELKKVYPDGVKKGHPAYQEKMDGDKDGHACE